MQKSPQQENRPPVETGRHPRARVTDAGWQEAPIPPRPRNYCSHSWERGIQKQLLCQLPASVLCLGHSNPPSAAPLPTDPCSLGVKPHLSQDISSPSRALPTGAWAPASFLGSCSSCDGAPSLRKQLVWRSLGRDPGFKRIISYHSRSRTFSVVIQTEGAVCPSQLAASSYPMDAEYFFRQDTCTGSVAH